MKRVKNIFRKQFIVDWSNIENDIFNDSNQVENINETCDDSMLFI
ncbi:hypothetical protein [Cognatitamlana onchidii]|nr:hypothetical protein [Algibacter onchidii]